jgi:hypothetical protein
MRWVTDRTGRFPQRPHYEPEELDAACFADDLPDAWLDRRCQLPGRMLAFGIVKGASPCRRDCALFAVALC